MINLQLPCHNRDIILWDPVEILWKFIDYRLSMKYEYFPKKQHLLNIQHT